VGQDIVIKDSSYAKSNAQSDIDKAY